MLLIGWVVEYWGLKWERRESRKEKLREKDMEEEMEELGILVIRNGIEKIC